MEPENQEPKPQAFRVPDVIQQREQMEEGQPSSSNTRRDSSKRRKQTENWIRIWVFSRRCLAVNIFVIFPFFHFFIVFGSTQHGVEEIGEIHPLLQFAAENAASQKPGRCQEVAFKTVPSASKVFVSLADRSQETFGVYVWSRSEKIEIEGSQIEFKRVLESVYCLEVEKVHTLNMEGKKKLNRKSRTSYRRPDYKKAYVILKNSISLPKDVFPLNAFEEGNKEAATNLKLNHNQGVKSAKRKS